MPFLSLAHMYQVVRDMYDSPKWRERVLHMTDNQIMAIYFDQEKRREARRNVFKRTLRKKIEERRGRIPKLVEDCKGCDEAVASCDGVNGVNGSTDDYIPEQLSFFD